MNHEEKLEELDALSTIAAAALDDALAVQIRALADWRQRELRGELEGVPGEADKFWGKLEELDAVYDALAAVIEDVGLEELEAALGGELDYSEDEDEALDAFKVALDRRVEKPDEREALAAIMSELKAYSTKVFH